MGLGGLRGLSFLSGREGIDFDFGVFECWVSLLWLELLGLLGFGLGLGSTGLCEGERRGEDGINGTGCP